MKKIKILFILLCIFVVFVTFSSIFFTCKNLSKEIERIPEKESLIIGFSQIGTESSWRIRNTESIFEAASEKNIKILFDDAKQKQSNQLKAIRSFIVYQVDVIVFVPIVSDGWNNVLQEAKEADIPVIVIDRQIDVDSSLYAGFLGENGYEEGRAAGKFLLQKVENMTNQKINILELSGTENSSIAIERAGGFRDIIQKDTRLNIIHSEDGDFLRSRGKEIMDKILGMNKGLYFEGEPIDVIFSHNDPMTLGLLESFERNGVSDYPIIISIDAEQECIDALVNGKIDCVVECNPNLGPVLMELVEAVAAKKEIPRVTYMNESVFTEDDDFSTYIPRGY
ncbi:MAG: ABC transporter substrate-binding protein [Spirochaetia bacterium]|nr:ABC transporter substrate-binding protein [Spirochaetia bacterium]MDD7609795.1 ABC transporter substrate-binding protein [Spirochaetales bacterium]MDY5914812.1 ABC transporter substrate-binding protein [Treponema sp.]